ncbi:zinc finger BED domain-containing protein 4-like [Paramisgurnus dabryanus]|uniref:zinc finger BED domain-containing protein 4-like n=1 Tax=Paramisgurnus dabryanus TaxID=90735 RepID=UPI0031F3DE5C
MSAVWSYFTVKDEKNKAECNQCKVSVLRGGCGRNLNTTNLIKHLQKHHVKQYEEFKQTTSAKKKSVPQQQQQTLREAIEKREKLAPESNKAKLITEKVTEFIVLDDQPLSVVENVGFRRLMECLEPRYIMPSRYYISDTAVPRESIAAAMEMMLNTWKIDKSKVHVVLRDNATNVIKAMNCLGVPSLGCFAHTLQLIVNEGLLSQRSVSDTVAIGRKIVGHFKHSPLAYSHLEDIQLELNMQPKRLQQDGLLEKIITVLAPFEELTKEVSSSSAFASDVIPSVSVLKRILTQQNEADEGIKTMKSTLLEAVNRRFRDVESTPLYSVATLLDPRYKDRYFTNAECSRHAKDALLVQARKMEEVLGRTVSDASQAAEGTSSELAAPEPAKISRVEATSKSRLGNMFKEILEESTVESVPQSTTTNACIEIHTYLIEPTIQRSDNALLYWKVNKLRFPCLAATATKFLSAPSTSVESERLFSSASIIIDERRNSLSAEKAEMLIFLKKNLPTMFK